MARIAGVNIPSEKKINISITYIFGIGRKSAIDICGRAGVDTEKRTHALTDEEVIKLREIIDKDYTVEGDLRRTISMNIKTKKDIKTYQGLRHILRLPVRGQRTHGNARTRKGKAVTIAGKKKV